MKHPRFNIKLIVIIMVSVILMAILICGAVILSIQALLELEEDDPCLLKSGEQGWCTIVNNCSYAIKLIKAGQKPVVCGFQGNVSIVCCNQLIDDIQPKEITKPSFTNLETFSEDYQNDEEISYDNDFIFRPPINPSICYKKCREVYPRRSAIHGGEPAKQNEFKHMAAIGFGDINDPKWSCGGSLISFKFILTAAHCTYQYFFEYYNSGRPTIARLGDTRIGKLFDSDLVQDIPIIKCIAHQGYSSTSKQHDIALVELERPAVRSVAVNIACLDPYHITRNYPNWRNELIATGWGNTGYHESFSETLMKVNLKLLATGNCKQNQYYNERIQLCAEGGDRDTCVGDSGGPLQWIDPTERFNEFYYVIGITSYGKPCGLYPIPGVYTNVLPYLKWIEKVVWPEELDNYT